MKKEKKCSSRTRTHRRYVNKPPTDEQKQNKLANELLDWVNNEDSFAIEDFPISKSIAPSRFYQCANDNEYFAEALELARYTIGSKLQKGMREKILPKDYVLRLLPLYNEEYKSLILDKINKNKEVEQGKQVFVVIPEICSKEHVDAEPET